ncbi:VWA domain-containing protein [Sphaerotilus mobilis]|uniref:VWA domain containing CoxE-like protein n=1 Tax=Sphaerotilus mobilis TaxID=47994 RepID=A0A4Q7LRJ8_9BURK|nr:VWA domain-containing protein [Sphaerotilus mobilis]RZS56747.1 VWA domain containing CoxE-like protein [Sphaerotilus mobilis]
MRALDAPYAPLDLQSRELWLPAIVNSAGQTARRIDHLAPWVAALEAGRLPLPEHDFGDPHALLPMRSAIATLGLPTLCVGVPALVLQVLRTLFWSLDRIVDLQPALSREAAIARVTADFVAEWTVQTQGWRDELALLRGLGDLAHLRWDEIQGLLRSREWQEAQRLSALLAHLQPLVELIRQLGRTEHDPAAPPADTTDADPTTLRLAMRTRETLLPGAPGELTGIHRSGRLDRLLGSEAAQIRHRVLHRLWRARLAEASLLTYDSQGVLHERVVDPTAHQPEAARTLRAPRQRGPIILCVDTSGSMQGAPEKIAKAVVLEALRTAQREQRGCLLIAFGGQGEMVTRELQAGRAGLDAMLELIGMGFDGGTDVQTPIEHAIDRVHQARWRSADLLIVSDGEFGCVPATLERLDQARAELGLRVQGILIGDRETMGLLETCDAIHWLRDWRRFESSQPLREATVPVHTASLTALYFPNALSARAARKKS